MENEYLCVNQHHILADVKAILFIGDKCIDVTFSHLFLGYKPMILAFPKSIFNNYPDVCTLKFYSKNILCGSIELIEGEKQHSSLLIFRGKSANILLLNSYQKIFHGLKQWRRHNHDALYPSPDSYNQIRVAYSFPRNISVVVLNKNQSFNIFPTDLHGEIVGQNQYIISLREHGLAYKQVSEASTISLSRVSSENFRTVYALGKNHMKAMTSDPAIVDMIRMPDSHFSFHSFILGNECIALRKINELKIGLHHLITFSIIDKITFNENKDTLSHIHEFYALWRMRHQFKDRLLIRAKNQ